MPVVSVVALVVVVVVAVTLLVVGSLFLSCLLLGAVSVQEGLERLYGAEG